MYTPPDKLLDYELVANLTKLENESILMGDLNAKSVNIGCKVTNNSGKVLEDLILNRDISIYNNLSPTYLTFKPENGYSEILDLLIGSSSLGNRIFKFRSLEYQTMGSDHCPISCLLSLNRKIKMDDVAVKPRFNFHRADWSKYEEILTTRSNEFSYLLNEDMGVEKLNERVTEDILHAVNVSIPLTKPRKPNSLPQNIVELIKCRREVRKSLKLSQNDLLRVKYNQLTSEIRLAVKIHSEAKWDRLLENHGDHPVAARPFWNEINKARSQKTSPNFPTLRHGDVVAKDDQQKASLFGSILKQTFSASFQVNDFDSDHYNLTESSNYENFSDEFPPIIMLELNKTILPGLTLFITSF